MAKLDQNIISKDLSSMLYLNNFLNFVGYRYEKPDEMFTIAPFPAICVCEIDFLNSSQSHVPSQYTLFNRTFYSFENDICLIFIKIAKFIINGRSCHTRMLWPIMLSYSKVYREAGLFIKTTKFKRT